MYGQCYADTVLNLIMPESYTDTVSKLNRSIHLHGSMCSEIPLPLTSLYHKQLQKSNSPLTLPKSGRMTCLTTCIYTVIDKVLQLMNRDDCSDVGC